ncbi:MAG: EamA/RhaT family transporter [Gemmatimonadetes bacterium]|nr:MAG: EamA/RhaT family transporter [Gemmatimonadota bacterium]
MERAIWGRQQGRATGAPGLGFRYLDPPMSPLLVLVVAVLATTYAGPIVRFAAAPALAIAFWRLALVLPVTGGLAVFERSGERGAVPSGAPLGTAPRALLPLIALSGLLLALHFWSWIASLRFTTVASSVVLVSLKPVFAWGLAAAWLREHPTRTEAWGIALAVSGAILIGLADARLSVGALGGDGLALLGAVAGAGYYVIGRRVRQTVGIWRYATVVYAMATAALALLALARHVPLSGFAGRDWAVFGAMAAGPMLVGHTGMNYALRHFRATTVNVAALGEPVGASVIAWLLPAIHEVPPPTALLGGVLVLIGIGVSLGAGSGR